MAKKIERKSAYIHLRDKWIARHKASQSNLFTKHKEALEWAGTTAKQVTVGSIGSLLFLAAPIMSNLPTPPLQIESHTPLQLDNTNLLVHGLADILPKNVQTLTPEQEQKTTQLLADHFGVMVYPDLGGKRLNTSYGYIGQEQHLMRYPGDSINTHFDTNEQANLYADKGMAPGRGAWGYFAYSQSMMTEEDKQREKYYIAVQTFLSKDFNERVAEYRDFYKYRKMLVVNPENGKAMVVVIADAGPGDQTGKQLGGSPEVMQYLERFDGSQKGPVLYYFIDDKENKIPLGPIKAH